MTLFFTIIYLLLLVFTILFQVGLILGKPWGEWTMGGYHKGALPIKLRFGSFISISILVLFVVFIINFTQILPTTIVFPPFFKWILISFNILAVIANSATKSQKERMLWQPITIIMLICSLVLFLT